MKQTLSTLALLVLVFGLTGCMDDPDKSSGKLSSSAQINLK
jgi:hypothetical protein